MAQPDSIDESGVFFERFRQWFTRSRSTTGPGGDQPQRRGFAITMCALIAVVLWFTLSLRETYPDVLEIPTQVVNVPEGEALAERPPSTVQVQVRGEGIELFRLHFNPPTLQINAQNDEVSLEDQVLDLPKGVSREGIVPRTIALQKEPRIDKQIPIRLRADIEPIGTHDLLYPPRLEPDSIIVSGARSIINDLEYWPTEYVRYRGLRDSLVVSVPLADTLASLVNKSNISTTLTAIAQPFTSHKRAIDVEMRGAPTSERVVTLVPSVVRISYRVPLSQFERAQQAEDFFATVSYEDIRADTTGRVEPEIHFPEGVILKDVKVTPSTLRYYERLVDQ